MNGNAINWMEFFSIVAAIALIVQVGILIALFVQMKKTTESINKVVSDLHNRVGPILTRTQLLLDDTQPKLANLVEDASQIVYLAKRAGAEDGQSLYRGDRSRSRAVGPCRSNSDRDARSRGRRRICGTQKKNLMGPVQKASALVRGN